MILTERHTESLTVVLEWDQTTDVSVVRIMDANGEWSLQPRTRKEATDMYYHPYAYQRNERGVTNGRNRDSQDESI